MIYFDRSDRLLGAIIIIIIITSNTILNDSKSSYLNEVDITMKKK